MINYLLLPDSPESYDSYRLLLMTLAGGYGHSEIQPVWISDKNQEDDLLFDQMKQLTADYSGARKGLRAIQKHTRLFSSILYPPTRWQLPDQKKHSAAFRTELCEQLVLSLRQIQNFPTVEQLREGEIRFVFLHHLEEAGQIGIDLYSALVVMNHASTIPVQTVVRVTNKSVDEKEGMLLPRSAKCLAYMQENGNLLVAGLDRGKEALLATDYVKLKAAIALAYVLWSDEGVSAVVENRGKKTGAYYTSDIFPSEQASMCLNAMGCVLGIYRESASGGLADWNQAFRTPTGNIYWPNWSEFQTMELFLQKSAGLVKSHAYRLDNPECVDQICKRLTCLKKIDAHSSLQERAVAQFLSLYNELKTFYPLDSLAKPDLNLCPLPDFSADFKKSFQNCEGKTSRDLRDIAVSLCPLVEASLLAFTPELLGCESARALRSSCLNIWEKVYGQEVLAQSEVYGIKELDLEKELNKIQFSLLSMNPEGKKVLSAEYIYMLYQEKKLVALSSPTVGFVPLYDEISGDNIRELGERATEFIVFMGMYAEMFSEQLSPLFVQYVRTQSEKLRSVIESDGYNVIAKYPSLRHHVGIDVTV